MFWPELADSDRTAVVSAGVERRFPRGSVLFREGEGPTHVLVILTGWVKVSRSALDGREIIIELRGPGDLLGELGLFDEQPRNATATAVAEVAALVIPAGRFRGLLNERGPIGVGVLSAVAQKLRQATDRRLADGTGDAVTRVCSRLLELAGEFDQTRVASIDWPFTQQELAEWVGISRESVVLVLRDLRRRGLVETGRRTIRLLDPAQLRAIADGLAE